MPKVDKPSYATNFVLPRGFGVGKRQSRRGAPPTPLPALLAATNRPSSTPPSAFSRTSLHTENTKRGLATPHTYPARAMHTTLMYHTYLLEADGDVELAVGYLAVILQAPGPCSRMYVLLLETEMEPETENPTSCLLYTSPSPRDATLSRMPSSA